MDTLALIQAVSALRDRLEKTTASLTEGIVSIAIDRRLKIVEAEDARMAGEGEK